MFDTGVRFELLRSNVMTARNIYREMSKEINDLLLKRNKTRQDLKTAETEYSSFTRIPFSQSQFIDGGGECEAEEAEEEETAVEKRR